MSDLDAAADWVVDTFGYPFDMGADAPPPLPFQVAIVHAWTRHPQGEPDNTPDHTGLRLMAWACVEEGGWDRDALAEALGMIV